MTKKYTLTEECITIEDRKLYRIKALRNVGRVKEGDLGGFVEYNDNLSQEDDAWLYHDAKVFGSAWVGENARIRGNACVYGNAQVFGSAIIANKARVFGNAEVYNNAMVYDNAQVYGNAEVYGDAAIYDNAQVYGDAEVHGRSQVYDYATVSGSAQVSGHAEVLGESNVFRHAILCGEVSVVGKAIVSRRPIRIEGLRHPITVVDNLVIIGCQAKSLKEWLAMAEAEIRKLGHGAFDFYRDYKDIIKKIVEKHQKGG